MERGNLDVFGFEGLDFRKKFTHGPFIEQGRWSNKRYFQGAKELRLGILRDAAVNLFQ
jgi:hypothetical protein